MIDFLHSEMKLSITQTCVLQPLPLQLFSYNCKRQYSESQSMSSHTTCLYPDGGEIDGVPCHRDHYKDLIKFAKLIREIAGMDVPAHYIESTMQSQVAPKIIFRLADNKQFCEHRTGLPESHPLYTDWPTKGFLTI